VSATPLTELSVDTRVDSVAFGSTRSNDAQFTIRAWAPILLGLDAAMFVGGSLAAQFGAHHAGVTPIPAPWLLVFAGVLFALLASRGLYSRRLQTHLLDDARVTLLALTLSAAFALSLQVVLTGSGDGELFVREWAFLAVYLIAGRTALHWSVGNAHRAGLLMRPTLIIGHGRIGTLLAERLRSRPELGLAPIGFLDKEPLAVGDAGADLPVLGASWDLERVVEEHGVKQVVVAFSTAPDHVLLRLLRQCDSLGVDVAFVPRFYERVGEEVGVEHLGGVSLLVPHRVDPRDLEFKAKYAVDRLIAGGLVAITAPLFLLVALAVRLSMGRPIFFRQSRVGRDGQVFEMLKFRSMCNVSGDEAPFVLGEGLGPGGVEGADRRTSLGRLLRATNIDELPQLLNVLRGEMSIVGPRPERPQFANRFESSVYRYGERHRVKAGITGWAQVHGLRGRTSIADRAEWDNFYIENFSLWLDLKILLMTAATVVKSLVPRPS
jgi:exopolysaccharide biosynthesis polyprenyl glycosylphosphotransferase